MTDITLSQDHFDHYQASSRALVMLVNENAELRCEVERLREQLDVERWDSFNAVLSCGVDERDVDRTFEGLSEHGVRQPRVIQFGERIPADVLIVRPDNATDFDQFAVRVSDSGWRYAETLDEAHEVLGTVRRGWSRFQPDEYPLTEVITETTTTAKAS
ncbi:hypothetical protein [Rhodococcus sp. BH5]|uniref:hypothetical protein n=1 Tax=Rhodococcus sp. BH5 TaxID=2871702 RepID=UPI0022CD9994|nr:hypothetical protein [Rhodococcus sp. BH5]MCZ9634684.1 hypothetical protein [Rhodococcus sp. BH5]